ncbi:MAG: serine/threonine-protein kinase, partial [Candidatus Acidiferrales bacterium]
MGEAGFAPGQMFAGRYRIVGLLGRGGMGEVFRAEDLRVGHQVALKFLHRKFAGDALRLNRFTTEVRLSRQISHPNVCRVYDLGESDGHHYLTMEYVDGEDLATLLKRIGRFPPDKALEIAHQLCAGLAAAHERGVLHRDLKPANVMIDGRGRARIMDFGLALTIEQDAAKGQVAGTPAYMAPEQLSGGAVSIQSDLYSLGLILYEVFTGKRALKAQTYAERLHAAGTPAEPLSKHTAVDDAVERAVQRCLQYEPKARPASALAVAASLPGGDPLAAALAAGETPSPEMVAAAGGESAVPLAKAWMLLGGVLLLMAAVIAISPYSTDVHLGRWEKGPAVLRQRAREVVSQFGYANDPADSATWMEREYAKLRYVASHLPAPGWRKTYADLGPPMLFGYRQSPHSLVAFGDRVTASNPPMEIPGMVSVVADTQGQLRRFRAVPPQIEVSPTAPAVFDWAPLFDVAGLDPARFEKREPMLVPPAPFDERAEWTGTVPELPDVPLTVSAAAFRGKLVHFELLGPWSQPEGSNPLGAASPDRRFTESRPIIAIVAVFLLFSAAFLARSNLRQGRGDRKGAFRLAQFLFIAGFLSWAVTAHHAGDPAYWVLNSLLEAIGQALFAGGFFWLLYIALEPYFRRRLPELMIGWARLMEGRLRDPRVGRDILTGALAGVSLALLKHGVNGLPTWFAFQGQTTIPLPISLDTRDLHIVGANPLDYLVTVHIPVIGMAFVPISLYFVFRLALRKPLLAAAGLLVMETLLNLGRENPWLELPQAILTAAVIVWVVTRFGLLAAISMRYFEVLLEFIPPSFDFAG